MDTRESTNLILKIYEHRKRKTQKRKLSRAAFSAEVDVGLKVRVSSLFCCRFFFGGKVFALARKRHGKRMTDVLLLIGMKLIREYEHARRGVVRGAG